MKRVGIRCSVCSKLCNLWYKPLNDYVYKLKLGNKYLIQCSYHCWREESGRTKERHGREED